MLLDDFVCNVKLLTVLRLSWEQSDADVAPRNYHAFSFRTEGNASYTAERTQLSVRNGDLLFVPQNVGYHIKAQKEDLYVIHFELPEKKQNQLEVFHIEDYTKTKKLFANCYEVWTRKEPGYYFKTLSLFYNILELVSISSLNTQSESTDKNLKAAMDYLHAHYTDPDLSVLSLCGVAHISDTWFRKLFFKYYGVKPVKYINALRINYAKELLESGYYNVQDVALMSGFEDTKYFSTIFRHYTGHSPSKFKPQKERFKRN